jgi:UDP-N-acetylglucosamine 2-epimerase (non-hydrolysing)/GDP/UDP-N,N'-diacetylbacillosamine 2-epimerase (hydrolysing)
MRKVCVITGSRAEYGLLSPVMSAIQHHPNLELCVIVTGMHLMDRFGLTINEIKKDGFRIDSEIFISADDDISRSFGETVAGISMAIKKINPDFILILGDRFDALAGAIAGATNNIIIAHIHGGDKTTSGHIDESIRFAITKFAHIHFVATIESKKRLIRFGEQEFRIYQVGSPAIDVILSKTFTPALIANKLNLNLNIPIIIVLQHPVSVEKDEAANQIRQTLLAIKELNYQTIIIYPNSDLGSLEMIDEIEKYRGISNIQIYKNIEHELFLGLLKISTVLVGNSSSGIIEAPSFNLPVVNVGSRNVGREHAQNVIFVDYDKEQILHAIKKALFDKEFKKKVNNCINPYGDGNSSNRIVEILATINIDKNLLTKQITY